MNNCGMVSTENIKFDFSGPFRWLMEMSMLGVGVGFDTNKKNNGIGLKNMASRANSIAAKIQIKSQVNNGTVIEVSIPTKTLYHEGKK